MSGVPTEHLFVGQVFHEDDDFITIKVAKRDDIVIELGESGQIDHFLTLVFLHRRDNGSAETWIPWENSD